jgi:hypothetical protein
MMKIYDSARSRISAARKSYRFAVTEWDRSIKSEKSRNRTKVIAQNILYAAIRGDICDHYFLSNCDENQVPINRSILTNKEWMAIHREMIKYRDAEKIADLIANKTMLASLLSKSGIRVVESIGNVVNGQVRSINGKVVGIENIFDAFKVNQLFLKPNTGRGGRGALNLSLVNQVVYHKQDVFDRSSIERGEFDGYVIQPVIMQHPALAKYHEPSLNTLRIVTANGNDVVYVIGCFLRVGVGGNHVDSWSAGGLAIRVCSHTCVATPFGVAKNRYPRFFSNHPDSGVSFGELKIPHLTKAFDLACQSHKILGPIATVGWDVAIDEGGPIVIEGNSLWGVLFFKVFDPDVLSRYYSIFGTRN